MGLTERGVTTGVTGHEWRATVTPWGAIEPWDGEPIDWYVAADDRWHIPRDEPAVRQVRIGGTPVVETRVRVPHGDVVHRAYSVADAGGITVIEVENESTMAVAIAFDRRDVLTERAIAAVPIEGIELPASAFIAPLGHRAVLRIGLAHTSSGAPGRLPSRLPTAVQVVRGWRALAERPSRFAVPDAAIVDRVVAARCEVALGAIPRASDDPAGYALASGELVRMGERADPWVPELVEAVEILGPEPGWDADVGLVAAGRVLAAAGEHRARRDLERIVASRERSPRPASPPAGVRVVAWLESLFARGTTLVPDGVPADWLGRSVEAHGVPTGDGSAVSFALRWHGDRPAVLWEQTGDARELTAPAVAPGWRSSEPTGEALWPAPASRPS